MKRLVRNMLVRNMTALSCALLLAAGAVGCSSSPAPQPAEVRNAAPEAPAAPDAQKQDNKKSGGQDPSKAGAIMLLETTFQAKSRWEGDTLHLTSSLENDEDNMGGVMACSTSKKMLVDDTAVVFEFSNDTVKCAELAAP